MTVLFLDVDGVLNGCLSDGGLDDDKLERLARIHEATGCEIVISSTWRLYPYKLERLLSALGSHGIRALDITPDGTVRENGRFVRNPRGYEIQGWLDYHPEVTGIAILDDEGDGASGPVPDPDGQLPWPHG